MDGWIADLRSARRAWTRRPGLALAALVTLALGISANTVIFSVVDAVFVHPLPYRDANRLVFPQLELRQGGMTYMTVPRPEVVRAWKKRAESFEGIEAYVLFEHRLDGGDVTVPAAWVTPEMFPFLGVEPRLGRTFTADEALAGERVLVLGYGLWQSRFGADPQILGKTLHVDGVAFTIVGVLPPAARFLDPRHPVRLWLPLSPTLGAGNEQASRLSMRALARLRRGVSPAAARAELDAAMSGLPSAQGQKTELLSPRGRFGELPVMILIVQAAVGCVLLIACTNVAQLLLAQGESRTRELTMRSVLGAGRLRLLRQLLTESLALGLLGGALALLLSLWGLAALTALLPESLRYLDQLELNGDVLAFAVAVSLATGVLAGLVPALRSSAPSLEVALRRGGAHGPPSRRLLLRGLVTLEVALSLAILAGAGSMVNTFVRWQNLGFGFDPDDLLIVTLELDGAALPTPASRLALADDVTERLADPPLGEVALANGMPSTLPDPVFARLEAEGGSPIDQTVLCPVVSVLPGYFRTLGIPLRDGRAFTDLDRAGSEPVAVISETMAKLLWGDAGAPGRRFRLGPDGEWLQVVGVVADVSQAGPIFEASQPALYRPFRQRPTTAIEVAVRSAADPALLAAELVARLDGLGPGVRRIVTVTFEERVRAQLATNRFHTLLMTLFAGIAAVMACVGIYGFVAFSVSRRTREIGIRMAVGARGEVVVREMLGRGMAPVLAGIVAGLFGAAAVAKILNAQVHDAIRIWNPLVDTGVAALVAAVALAAVWLPARRATQINPTVTLRHDG